VSSVCPCFPSVSSFQVSWKNSIFLCLSLSSTYDHLAYNKLGNCDLLSYDTVFSKMYQKILSPSAGLNLSILQLLTKNNNHQLVHKKYIIFTIKTSYMFRPRWVIFRENSFVTLGLHLYSWVRMCHWLRTPLRGNCTLRRQGVNIWTYPDRGDYYFLCNIVHGYGAY
jgi:hypothetical protein